MGGAAWERPGRGEPRWSVDESGTMTSRNGWAAGPFRHRTCHRGSRSHCRGMPRRASKPSRRAAIRWGIVNTLEPPCDTLRVQLPDSLWSSGHARITFAQLQFQTREWCHWLVTAVHVWSDPSTAADVGAASLPRPHVCAVSQRPRARRNCCIMRSINSGVSMLPVYSAQHQLRTGRLPTELAVNRPK